MLRSKFFEVEYLRIRQHKVMLAFCVPNVIIELRTETPVAPAYDPERKIKQKLSARGKQNNVQFPSIFTNGDMVSFSSL